MDENRKRIIEKLKRDREIMERVKKEFGHEYSKLEDKTKYRGPVGKNKEK